GRSQSQSRARPLAVAPRQRGWQPVVRSRLSCRSPAAAELHPKPPRKKRGRVLPDARFAVTEHDYDDVASRPRPARDQAMAGRLAREAARHIIGTLNEKGAEQLDSLVRFARLDV